MTILGMNRAGRSLVRSGVRLFLIAAPLFMSSTADCQVFTWARQLVGTTQDLGYAIAVDPAGSVYTVGTFRGIVDFDPGPGTHDLTSVDPADAYITKLDSAGNLVWAKEFVGTGSSTIVPYGVAVDAGGDVYTVGVFFGTVDFDPGAEIDDMTALTVSGAFDVFVSKLDSAGNFVWAKRLGRDAGCGAVCSNSNTHAAAVAVDSSGDVYTVGWFNGMADFDPGPGVYDRTSAGGDDIFISKLDSAGNFVWAAQVGGLADEEARGVAVDSGGNVISVGRFGSEGLDFDPGPGVYARSGPGYDAFILKLDGAGNFVWAKQLGGPLWDEAFAVALDPYDDVYTVGRFSGLADFNPSDVADYRLKAFGVYDTFISKLTPAGEFIWARQLGGSGAVIRPWSVAVDAAANVYTTGTVDATADFDPGAGVFDLGGPGFYMSKLDFAGRFLWAGQVAGTTGLVGSGSALDPIGNLHITGWFSGSPDFDPGPGAYDLTSGSNLEAFTLKLNNCDFFIDRSAYGQLLFPPLCNRDASYLNFDVYDSISLDMFRSDRDRFFLSSSGGEPTAEGLGPAFTPLVVDNAMRVNGLDSGLGPYSYQPGVPPLLLGLPTEFDFVPLPPREVTDLIAPGEGTALFELLDTDRAAHGHTAVYLVRDCGIVTAGNAPMAINWVSHDDQVAGTPPEFEIRYGLISNLRADRNFDRVACLGHYDDTPATVTRPDPPLGDGYYYLARGLSGCIAQGYGDSGLVPDPRDALDALAACP